MDGTFGGDQYYCITVLFAFNTGIFKKKITFNSDTLNLTTEVCCQTLNLPVPYFVHIYTK